MHHINNNGEAKICRAKAKENCRFYRADAENGDHFESADEAATVALQRLKESRENSDKPLTKREKYSFTAEFKKVQEAFNQKFEGVSNRFYNYDLRGKYFKGDDAPEAAYKILDELDKQDLTGRIIPQMNGKQLYARMMQGLTSPADMNKPENEVIAMAQDLGVTNIEKFNSHTKGTFWKGDLDGKTIVITSDKRYEDFTKYVYKGKIGVAPTFTVRTLTGFTNEKKITGSTHFGDIVANDSLPYKNERIRSMSTALKQLEKLEAAQNEGRNHQAQAKYVKSHSSSVATAWMDKKNADATHVELAKTTSLRKNFRNVEIDNDVSAAEFKDFENQYNSIKDKLPKIPGDRQPELRIRKLGKHRAEGVYFPHKNTVCIDVHTSSAFVHEMGHYYDIAVKNNSSLSQEFHGITRSYASTLKVPEELGASKVEYYTTPTEVMARGFEMYSVEKLGLGDTRLVDPERFTRFDYKPFSDNPELKEKLFKFYDNLFNDERKN